MEEELNENNNGVTVSRILVKDLPKAESGLAEQAATLLAAPDSTPTVTYRVYRFRWYVLGVVCLLNCSNSMSWIAYAPVANYVDKYYGLDGAANWCSVVFLMAAIPIAFFAMWSERKFGPRSAILLAGWSNAIGASIRLLSNVPGLDDARLYVVLIGQCVAACAYPFIMFLPTKVAATWFPSTQRTLATSIGALSNPLGVMLANLISPQLVRSPWEVVLLNVLTFIPCFTGCLLATVGIRTAGPTIPPTRSAAQTKMLFVEGLKKCLTSRAYLLLLICLGGGIGMFNTLYTIMQQMLCPKGYPNSFAGMCCALMIVGGIVGSIVASFVVVRTKLYEETMKTSFSIAVIFGVVLAQCALRPYLDVAVAISAFCFGVFGLAAYPLGLDMGAECTFPVAEPTSTGLIVLSGQIQGALYILMITKLARPLMGPDLSLQVCTDSAQQTGDESTNVVQAKEMTLPMLLFCGIGVLLACVFVLFFRPKLRRLTLENQDTALKNMPAQRNVDLYDEAKNETQE